MQPLHEQPTRMSPELDHCTYVEIVSPAFDPNRALLLRVFLIDDKLKYVSGGYYPAQNINR